MKEKPITRAAINPRAEEMAVDVKMARRPDFKNNKDEIKPIRADSQAEEMYASAVTSKKYNATAPRYSPTPENSALIPMGETEILHNNVIKANSPKDRKSVTVPTSGPQAAYAQ